MAVNRTKRELQKQDFEHRQAIVVDGVLKGKSPQKICKEMGVNLKGKERCTSFIQSIGKTLSGTNSALVAAFDRAGITFDSIASVHAEAMKATVPLKVAKIMTEDEHGNRGEEYTHEMIPDHKTRLAAVNQLTDMIPGIAPAKQVTTETKTFEQRLILVEKMRENPQAIMEYLERRMITQKTTVNPDE